MYISNHHSFSSFKVLRDGTKRGRTCEIANELKCSLATKIPLHQKSKKPVTHDHDRQLMNVQTSDYHLFTFCIKSRQP